MHYSDEYYSVLLLAGHTLTSLEGGGPCSLSTFNYWVAGHLGVFGRSVQQNGYLSKDPKYRPGAIFKGDWQVMLCYIITECATPIGGLVMWFTSQSWEPLFESANNVAGTALYNHVMGEHN